MKCSGTNRQGEPCNSPPMKDSDTCYAHSGALAEGSRDAALKSAQVRKARVERREEASEAAALTLTQRIRAEVAADADGFAKALVAHAKANPQSAAMTEVLNRTEGKVVEKVQTVDHYDELEAFTTEQLQAWLNAPVAERTPAEDPTITPNI